MPFCNENNADEIIKNLWLGNYIVANDIKFINEKNIKYIINMTPDIDNTIANIVYMKIPVIDDKVCLVDMNNIFDETTRFILDGIENGGVLVHCMYGHHRSASIIAGFLIRFLDVNVDESINYIQSKRHCALVRESCMVKALREYYIYCHEKLK